MESSNKNEWVEDMLGGAEKRHRAVPDARVWDNILTGIKDPVVKGRIIPISVVSAAAACILLLLALNIYSVVQEGRGERKEDAARALVQYYDITNDKAIGL